jgi:hypothetical protein
MTFPCTPPTPEEHEKHLRKLFQQLSAYGILINPAKCVFRAAEVTFLGYKVSGEGSRQLEDRAANLQACPPSKKVQELRRFLGMLNFYRRFLPHAATTQALLHDVLAGPRVKNSHPITCTPALSTAIEKSVAHRHVGIPKLLSTTRLGRRPPPPPWVPCCNNAC